MQPPAATTRPRLSLVRTPALADASDGDLARAAIEGHPGAPAAVWDRFSVLLRGVLRRSLGPGHEVEDHVQEVFLRLFKEISNLREPDAMRPFAIGIAIRVARGELRRRRIRRWLRLTDGGIVPEQAAGEPDDDAREALVRLYAILDRIDDADRLAFVLRYIEGLELTMVASSLGVSLATVKRRLAAAAGRIRAMASRDPLLSGYLEATP